MKTHAQIECPSCSELTDVEGEDFVCDKCRSSLAGYIYKKHKKSIFTAIKSSVITTSLAIGGLYVGFDKFLDKQYPIGYEYEIVSACVNADNTPLDEKSYQEKQKICICAYGKVTKKFHYNETEKPEYQNDFLESVNKCGIESQTQPAL